MNTFDANTFIQAPAVAVTAGSAINLAAATGTPVPSYSGYESSKYGHRICGLNNIKMITTFTGFSATRQIVGYIFDQTTPNPNF